MLNIILFGPPGSGKGTQSALITQKYNLKHLSTGDILRAEIKNGTELGRIADSYIASGNLVPDKMIIDILMNAVNSANGKYRGMIYDGFPRTLVQAQALEDILEHHEHNRINVLIELHLDENVLIERLLKRGETSGRSDDNIDAIRKRLEVYKSQSRPAAEFYKSRNKYAAVDGLGTVEEILERISNVIETHL